MKGSGGRLFVGTGEECPLVLLRVCTDTAVPSIRLGRRDGSNSSRTVLEIGYVAGSYVAAEDAYFAGEPSGSAGAVEDLAR